MSDAFERARRFALEQGLAATLERRLDWLEEMIELARQSGALRRELERRHRARQRPAPPGNR